MEWTAQNIRNTFLQFFENKKHEIVPSAPMVVKDDPTLMFTNAGMNQFKDVFLGDKEPKSKRIVDSQKCLRVSGKHNDLEEVGVDTYHHTMFEMLGNWSFGDYFKQESIDWAWELLTKVYKLDEDRLYATVFEGDKADDLGKDEEAYSQWQKWLPKSRILNGNKKDNFWEMGETGPCGPCSEIHIDLRTKEERDKQDGAELVNKDHPLVIEIWNLVFMQYNRAKGGALSPLPSQHVDTGMGFERLCMALQNKTSNYDTDVFQPIIKKIEELTKTDYSSSSKDEEIAIRVISDHIRAVSFSIADGQLPSNTGAGYVIRRILRRAIRYGFSFLNKQEAFIYELVSVLCEQMGEQFPELKAQQTLIEKVIKEEEENFLRTLENGISRFENKVKEGEFTIKGEFAFELYDTFGFPIDLTQLMAREKGIEVDMKGFDKALQQQKERSRAATKVDTEDWVEVLKDDREEFVGYDYLETEVKITRYRKVKSKDKEQYQLVFNITPFYAEGGGQVGDSGYIEAHGEKVSIKDTKKENQLIVHFVDELPKDLDATFKAVVNQKKRTPTACNHSATHLLHEALREVLGDHVQQKGSLVNEKHLRFDFSHFQKMTDEEVEQVEKLVNERIRKNLALEEKRNVPFNDAKNMGAMALFGEKYGDTVRVIKFGSSVELCGGIHVPETGQIGSFTILHESAVAAGIRRVEAITAEKSQEFINGQINTLKEIKQQLKNPKDVQLAITNLLKENSELKKKLEAANKQGAMAVKEELLGKVELMNGVNVLTAKVELDSESIKDIAFQLKKEVENLLLVLGAENEGKALLTVAVSDNLVKEKDLHAGNIIRELAKEIQGGGGGQPFFATAGGKNPAGIEAALQKAKELV